MAEYIERGSLRKHIGSFTGMFTDDGFLVNLQAVLNAIDFAPAADVVEIPPSGMGDLSDGYHTFNELYHHRAVLFSVICNALPTRAWKSKRHDTGDMYDGMFIVGIETPQGQVTYHYDVELYWDMFKVKELDRAPTWDGHTPAEAIERIATLRLVLLDENEVTIEDVSEMLKVAYERGKQLRFIANPIEFALNAVWHKVVGRRKRK